MDVSFLSDHERTQLLDVLRREEEDRKDTDREVQKIVQQLVSLQRSARRPPKSTRFQTCFYCRDIVGVLFRQAITCSTCDTTICVKCCERVASRQWLCIGCTLLKKLKSHSGCWFYSCLPTPVKKPSRVQTATTTEACERLKSAIMRVDNEPKSTKVHQERTDMKAAPPTVTEYPVCRRSIMEEWAFRKEMKVAKHLNKPGNNAAGSDAISGAGVAPAPCQSREDELNRRIADSCVSVEYADSPTTDELGSCDDLRSIAGFIRLAVYYSNKHLVISVLNCYSLTSSSVTVINPFVKLYLLPDENKVTKRKTKVLTDSNRPHFDALFNYEMSFDTVSDRTLWVSVWSKNMYKANTLLGEAMIELSTVDLTFTEHRTYSLALESKQCRQSVSSRKLSLPSIPEPGLLKKFGSQCSLYSVNSAASFLSTAGALSVPIKGSIRFALWYSDGQLCVYIHSCSDLVRPRRTSYPDAYVKARLIPDLKPSSKRKTKAARQSTSPVYHQMMKWMIDEDDVVSYILWLSVWDKSQWSSNTFLGEVRLLLNTVNFSDDTPKEYFLSRKDSLPVVEKRVFRTAQAGLPPLGSVDECAASPTKSGQQMGSNIVHLEELVANYFKPESRQEQPVLTAATTKSADSKLPFGNRHSLSSQSVTEDLAEHESVLTSGMIRSSEHDNKTSMNKTSLETAEGKRLTSLHGLSQSSGAKARPSVLLSLRLVSAVAVESSDKRVSLLEVLVKYVVNVLPIEDNPTGLYIKCYLLPDKRTKGKTSPTAPCDMLIWNETLRFNVCLSSPADLAERVLDLQLLSKVRLGSNAMVGALHVGTRSSCTSAAREHWQALMNTPVGEWVERMLELS